MNAARTKMRLDQALVAQGRVASRSRAGDLIRRGFVQVDGKVCKKPATSITNQQISADDFPWVSRAGLKLAGALEVLGVPIVGRHCLDLGASTGGFTQVLLASGAAHVTAVDVGTDQLHPDVAGDPRVLNWAQRDVRTLTAADFATLPDMLVSDLSFISLSKALPAALGIAPCGADLIALFKPQFEVGRAHVDSGGIVRDGDVAAQALARFSQWLEAAGWRVYQTGQAAISGGDGNQETWVAAKKR